MVKGVNKTIIEINNTESEYFDRILLFVNARHKAGGAKLDDEAVKISQVLAGEKFRIPLRKMNAMKKRKMWIWGILVATSIALCLAAVYLIF